MIEINEKKIALIISCFDWYEKRIKYIENYLDELGYQVIILTSDFDHIKKKKTENFLTKENVQYIAVPEYKSNISIRRIQSHVFFAKKSRAFIKENKPYLIYALVPPNYLLKVLAENKKYFNYKLIIDVIDLWPESFPIGKTNIFPFAFWRNMRTKNINSADQVVLECKLYKKQLGNNLENDKIHILYLTGEAPQQNAIAKSNIKPNDKIVLGYLGSINSLIDIDCICSIIGILRTIKLVEVEIVGCGKKTKEFIRRLKECGSRVNYYGAVFDEKEKFKIFKRCHFGINIYKTNVKIGLTIKSIDYFKYGLPILNTIGGDTEELVDKYHAGINVCATNNDVILDEMRKYNFNTNNILEMYETLFSKSQINERLYFLDEYRI